MPEIHYEQWRIRIGPAPISVETLSAQFELPAGNEYDAVAQYTTVIMGGKEKTTLMRLLVNLTPEGIREGGGNTSGQFDESRFDLVVPYNRGAILRIE